MEDREYFSEYENAVLAGVLQGRPAQDLLSKLERRDFTTDFQQSIYQAIETLHKANTPIDMLTISAWMKQRGHLKTIDDRQVLVDLAGGFTSNVSFDYYCKDIREKRVARLLYEAAEQIEGGSNPLALAKQIAELSTKPEEPEEKEEAPAPKVVFRKIGDITRQAIVNLEERAKYPNCLTGVPSGIPELDDITQGFQPGDLVLLGARTGIGKTVIGLNIAQTVSSHYQAAVWFVNLEMTEEALARRNLASMSGVWTSNMKRGTLNDNDWNAIARVEPAIRNSQLYITDAKAGVRTVPDLQRGYEQLVALGIDVELIIVDHVHRLRDAGGSNERKTEVERIGWDLKMWLSKIGRPMLALCQLSRAQKGKESAPPTLNDLRESGTLEENADIALMLHRLGYYNADADQHAATLYVRKHRDGQVGEIELTYHGTHSVYESKYRKEKLKRMKDVVVAPQEDQEEKMAVDPKLVAPWSDNACRGRAAQLMTESQEAQQAFWDRLNCHAEVAGPEEAAAILRNYARIEEEFDKLNTLAAEQPPEDFFADDEPEDFFE